MPGRYDLLLRCWDDKPEDRPTFIEILHQLEHFLELIAEYFDISGLRIANCPDVVEENTEQAYARASPTGKPTLQTRIVAPPNDYCEAQQIQ